MSTNLRVNRNVAGHGWNEAWQCHGGGNIYVHGNAFNKIVLKTSKTQSTRPKESTTHVMGWKTVFKSAQQSCMEPCNEEAEHKPDVFLTAHVPQVMRVVTLIE